MDQEETRNQDIKHSHSIFERYSNSCFVIDFSPQLAKVKIEGQAMAHPGKNGAEYGDAVDRRPQQARSRATLDRIIKVAMRAIEADRLDALTIPDIVQQAKCSTGAFYGRFESKSDLMAMLLARDAEALSEAMAGATANAMRARDVRGWIESLIALSLDQALSRQSLLRAHPPLDRLAHRERLVALCADMLARLGASREAQAPLRAEFILTMITGLTRDAVLAGTVTADADARKLFSSELERAAVWYLAAG